MKLFAELTLHSFVKFMYFTEEPRTSYREMERRMNTSCMKRWQFLCMSAFITLIPVPLLLLNGCSGGIKLTSDWQQREMNSEGTEAQWQRGLYYDRESDVVYGVRNDEQYVYVFLKTQNRSTLMQIFRNGLTVWFDREDGKHQTFGIQYPMGRKEARTGFVSDTNEEKVQPFLDQEFPELAVLGPKKNDVQRFSALDAPGIRVKLSRTHETLTYELRVPLKKTSEQPFAIDPASSSRFGIEFETGEFNRDQMKGGIRTEGGPNSDEGMGEENPAEGVGMNGGRRHRGGGSESGRSDAMGKTKRMELWLSVQLARSVSP
jgi:hypothetical protein